MKLFEVFAHNLDHGDVLVSREEATVGVLCQ